MLLYKPNVYADFSAQTFLLSTRELSTVLRSWLEFVPEKVLFGTDAFEITPDVGWPEHAWVTTKSAREALALALTGMMKDGQITRERALELARLVMRENTAKLHGLAER
jgi:predicted TIM-barrel fold metal-dependent hydrolase